MKRLTPTIYINLLILVLVGGCCTARFSNDPLTQYRKRHPEDAKEYSVLSQTDLNSLKGVFAFCMGSWSGYSSDMKNRFSDVPGIKAYAEKMIEYQAELMRFWRKLFKELEDASAHGGGVYQFEWSDGKTKETGLLAIRAGEILEREVMITEYISEESEK